MIEKIEIHNYKSIQHLELELRGLNVLIGSNGVGKSNFISFFEMVNAMYNQRLGSYTIEKGGIDNLLYFGRKNSDAINGLIDFDKVIEIARREWLGQAGSLNSGAPDV